MKRLILLFLMMFLLTGCAQSQPQEVTAAPTEPPLEYRKTALTYDGIKDGWRVEFDNFTYSFACLEPWEEWDGMVAESRAIVQLLEERFGEIQGRRTLCMIYRPCEPFQKNNILYIGQNSFQTLDYAIGIAQMLYGNEVNYGLLYALGSEIAQERGYSIEEPVSLEEALALCDTAPVYLDMNYACFLDNYTDEETLPKVKTLARAFFASLTEKEKADLLINYSDEKYCNYLSVFLEANGKPGYDNADLGGTLFYNGGEDIRLVWENEAATFYVHRDFQEAIYMEEVNRDILNGTYEQLRQLVIDYRLQTAYLRERLGKFATQREKPDVLFFPPDEIRKTGGRGMFFQGSNVIHLKDHMPFFHDYVHYLTQDAVANGWLQELMAHYYTTEPGDPHIAYVWLEDKTVHEQVIFKSPEYADYYTVFCAATEHLDHEFDWNSPEDYAYLNNVYISAWDLYDNVTDQWNGWTAKSSFVQYLVSLVGEEKAIESIYNNSPEEIWGKTWDVLRADWKAAMETEFAWTSELSAQMD